MGYYRTYYRVLNDISGSISLDHFSSSAVCFASYSSHKYDGKHSIQIRILKEYKAGDWAEMAFTSEQVRHHLFRLASCGFPAIIEEKETEYILTLRESMYYNLSHIRIALDFIRLLWEKNTNSTLKAYWRLPEDKRNKGDYLFLLQLLSKTFAHNSGHTLPCTAYGYGTNAVIKTIPSEPILEFLETKNRSHNSGSFAVWNAVWGDYGKKVDQTEVKKQIEELSKAIKKG